MPKAKVQKRRVAYKPKPKLRENCFRKLRGLDCFEEVDRRLRQGWPPTALARYIQLDQKEYTDVGEASLVGTLKRYRATIPDVELVQQRVPQVIEKAVTQVEEGLDELKELERLYRLQMRRIEIDHAQEREMGKLYPALTQDVRVARELIDTYAQLRMDMGIKTRQLGVIDVDARVTACVDDRYPGTRAGLVLRNPEKRQKLLGLVQQVALFSDRNVSEVIEAQAEVVE